jgi:hypothetical protein
MQQTFQCYKCGAQNNMGQPHCWNCQAQFQYNCPNCHAPVQGTMVNCPYCGVLLSWPSQQQTVLTQTPQKHVNDQNIAIKQEDKKETINKRKPWLVGCSVAAGVVVFIILIAGITSKGNPATKNDDSSLSSSLPQTPSVTNTSPNSNVPGQSSSSSNLAQYVSTSIIDLHQTNNFNYVMFTNSSNKLVTLSFDLKNYDKDGDYLSGFRWDLTDSGHSTQFYPPCVLPMSTLAIGASTDLPKISNVDVRELTTPFTAYASDNGYPANPYRSAYNLYSDIAFVDNPIIGTGQTLDEKWGVPTDEWYYLVGEIKNSGQKNPDQIWCQVVLKDKGNIVGIYQSLQTVSHYLPPGEKMKFKMRLGLFPNKQGASPLMPKSYDSFNFVLWSWLLTKAK